MATCSYCRENIPDDSTVCARCGTFGPFSPRQAPLEPEEYLETPPDLRGFPPDSQEDYPAVPNYDQEGLPSVPPPDGEESDSGREGSGCWGFIKDLGCQYGIGCGGIVIATVIGVIVVLIASVCGGDDGTVECQDLHDDAMDTAMGWVDEDTGEPLPDYRILEITSDVERASTEPGVEICHGVAQTTDGAESIYYVIENGGSYTIYTETLDEPPSVPAPAPRR